MSDGSALDLGSHRIDIVVLGEVIFQLQALAGASQVFELRDLVAAGSVVLSVVPNLLVLQGLGQGARALVLVDSVHAKGRFCGFHLRARFGFRKFVSDGLCGLQGVVFGVFRV